LIRAEREAHTISLGRFQIDISMTTQGTDWSNSSRFRTGLMGGEILAVGRMLDW
jgi:hypothetical protein